MSEMQRCQSVVHRWGRDNRVAFDPAKEEFKIIHPFSGTGDSFKYLGPIIDTQIRMHDEIQRIVKKCRPKIRAIMRMRGVYNAANLIQQFKTHVWCLLEGSVGAIFHAYNSDLDKLDNLQNSFVRQLNMTPENAFIDFNFAPLHLRRDIGCLGLLFKVSRGIAHQKFSSLFSPALPREYHSRHSLRSAPHQFQIHDFCDGRHSDLMSRSMFGMVRVWNKLPSHLVEAPSVSAFQNRLTELARSHCRQSMVRCSRCFSGRPV